MTAAPPTATARRRDAGSVRALLGDLWAFDRRGCLTVLAIAVAAAATEGVGLVMLVPLLARVDADAPPLAPLGGLGLDDGAVLALLLGGFVALVAVRALLVRAQAIRAEALRLSWVDSLRVRAFKALTDAELTFVLRERAADVVQTLGPDTARIGMLTTAVTTTVVRGLVVLAAVVAGAIVAPWPTLAALATGALAAGATFPLVRRARTLGHDLTKHAREHLAITTAFLDGVRQSKAHTSERGHVAAYALGADDVRRAQLEHQRVGATLAAAQQAVAATALATIVAVAVGGFGLGTARLVPVLVLTSRVLSSVGPLSDAVQRIAHMLPAHAAVHDFLRRAAAAREPAPTGPPPPFTATIVLDDVSFTYPGRSEPAFAGSLEVGIGSTVVLVGGSGSGKSTALDLLGGLLAPSSGVLRVDGVALDAGARRAWRGAVAYVPQTPLLTPASVRDNLCWGSPATDEDLATAIADAGLAEVIARLPDGLDTVLARDAGLSGGERQRLNLARALLRRPSLLLLDEPTSALDEPTRMAIHDALARLRGHTTVVIATHRPDGLVADAHIDLGRAVVS